VKNHIITSGPIRTGDVRHDHGVGPHRLGRVQFARETERDHALWMVEQTIADGQVVQRLDVHVAQVPGRADPGEHQELRAVESAAGHHDLDARLERSPSPLHTHRASAFDDDSVHGAIGQNGEIGG
jgi:hypothetical protein